MDFEKLKVKGFILFWVCILALVITAILWIWEVIESDFAWKAIMTLCVVGFALLFLLTIGQKVFEKK